MGAHRFKTVVVKNGAGALVPIPFDPDEAWGDKEKHYVAGKVAGLGVRGVLETKGEGWFLSLGAACIRGFPIPTTALDVELLPEGPQVDELSADIREAFAAAPEARRFFESLATFYRTGFVKPIKGAKLPATRAARIEEMISLLKEGKRQK